ncbi:hypothetical protein [Tardiphaga sp.]|uniref:hypothetical protein n=1 Tax=Tardiphaga sp. TaxID=1926292 RepID=UPI00260BC302|nr:hypothetical protein [Tardiphaga sp.]
MSDMLERACRRLAVKDGRDPDRWRQYIDASQRSRVHSEIDAERDRGLTLCAIALAVIILAPMLLGASS